MFSTVAHLGMAAVVAFALSVAPRAMAGDARGLRVLDEGDVLDPDRRADEQTESWHDTNILGSYVRFKF